ncbi:type II toxin-antitoxin system RelE/ParE family toxin [Paratractidigestivibacter sp.]|uniref:type II toxin-antitoxin system RelE/ParE family toxin n=1 Tax=Paratractidigestivibacter sp. TaxID=2847316 RepID=UPI002AC95F44|nr:type II toxin-antitoxin system RelE/ParE family toxin [Paratractidigestivibacter sp.]
MTYKVLETATIKREPLETLHYIEGAPCEPSAAVELAGRYIEFAENVGAFPEVYPQMREAALQSKGFRKAALKNYLVLYRIDGGIAYVIHLFHQSRDYARLV